MILKSNFTMVLVVITALFSTSALSQSTKPQSIKQSASLKEALANTQVSQTAILQQKKATITVSMIQNKNLLNKEKIDLKADPIRPFLEPNAQSICDPCSMATFCFNLSSNACDAYIDAEKRGRGMESILGGVVFGGGGLMGGMMIGAVVGYVLAVAYSSSNFDFFAPQSIAAGTVLAILFSIPFGLSFGGLGTVWGLKRGPDLFNFQSNSSEASPAEQEKNDLPAPPAPQTAQLSSMPF